MSTQRSFAQRLSPLIAAFGVACVPGLLTRYQRRLGLTNNEVVYLLHVLDHRWDGDAWPWVSVAEIREANGAGERSIRDWRASLVKKGYLVLRRREHAGRGRALDEHDLTSLFAALEAFALEPTARRAALEARQQLPEPTFYTGMSAVPDADLVCRQQRPGLCTKRVQAKALRDVHSAETGRVKPAITLPVSSTNTLAITLPVSSTNASHVFKEAIRKKPLTPQPPFRGRGDFFEDDGRRWRRRPSGTTAVDSSTSPEDLVDGLYRGLGVGPETSTARMRKSELAIAHGLVDVGATPDEVEAYARETNARPGRTTVNMATFEKDRPSWLARRTAATVAAANSIGTLSDDPWKGRRPPIAEADLVRARVVGI
jgi:hypothetical protein